MLERLANACKVTVAALLPKAATAPAYRLKFDVRLLFPDGQAFTESLLGLMMAVEDARHLQRLLIKVRETERATVSDREIVNGEIGHLFRLLCVPLFEAVKAFETLDTKCPALLDAAVPAARAKEVLQHVRHECPVILHRRERRAFIDVVWNQVGAHYIGPKLRKTLDKRARAGRLEGTLLMTPFQGIGRYTVMDHLALFLIVNEMGGDISEFPQTYKQEVGKAIDLVGALGDVVDYLGAHLLVRPNQKIERERDFITIDPLIVLATRAVNRGRRHQKTI